MIQFVTLFLGLVFGRLPVEVAVGAEVVSVEIRVDGVPTVRYSGPPWTIPLDLGPDLAPRELVAIAYDHRNREVGRDRQWLNLPSPHAQIRLSLSLGRSKDEPSGRSVRATWESAVGSEPTAFRILFDGRELDVRDPREFSLPPVDEDRVHVLAVELEFPEGVTASGHATFGGTSSEGIGTDLTAVPIRRERRRGPEPDPDSMDGWFTAGDSALSVFSVVRDDPELTLVVDRDAHRLLQTASPQFHVSPRFRLPKDLRIRMVSTEPEARRGVHLSFAVFPIDFRERPGGDLLQVLESFGPALGGRTRDPSGAVATAGLQAFGEGRRRAVVFLRGREVDPVGSLEAHAVRRYLGALAVPLFVWDQESDLPAKGWGETRFVGSPGALAAAYVEVLRELDRQWIVWLRGRHLPQSIELDSRAEGWKIAGRSVEPLPAD